MNNLPVFIRASEERILKNIQLDLFRRNQTANLTSNNPYLNCPSDFLAPFSLSFTDGSSNKVLCGSYKDCLVLLQSYNPNVATTGSPQYYAQFDVDNFIVAPHHRLI